MQDRVILAQVEPRGPSELIEVPFPAAANGQQKVPFPTVEDLRSDENQRVILKGMRLITADVAVGAPLIAGPTAPLSELQKMFLVLYAEGWEKAVYIPLLTLNDVFTEASGVPFRHGATRFNNWEKVAWNKCFIQLANGTVVVGAPYVVMFDVEYVKLGTTGDMKGKEITGPS